MYVYIYNYTFIYSFHAVQWSDKKLEFKWVWIILKSLHIKGRQQIEHTPALSILS